MLGLGENEFEIIESMKDLRKIDVDIITLGQYLQPTKITYLLNLSIQKNLKYENIGYEMGFRHVGASTFFI